MWEKKKRGMDFGVSHYGREETPNVVLGPQVQLAAFGFVVYDHTRLPPPPVYGRQGHGLDRSHFQSYASVDRYLATPAFDT
jgi:hypothetical protein